MSGAWHVLCWILSGARGPSKLPATIFDRPAKEHTILDFPIELLDLPIELLQHIAFYLPLPSQVCLALSSKDFHQLFKSVLRASALRFPLMSQKRESYAISKECHLRMTLLTQLEDSHWACCSCCQKLHPRQEFPDFRLELTGPWDRACMSSVGILDLCPCIALTLRDRTRIVEYLRGTANSNRILNYISNGSLCLNNDEGGLHLLHRCDAYQNIQAEFKLSLTESNQLISCDRYETLPAAADRDMDAVPVCCNKDLSCCFLNSTPVANCSLCHARTTALTSLNANVRVAQVTRYLWREKWVADLESVNPGGKKYPISGLLASLEPDGQWYTQRRRLHIIYPHDYLGLK